MKKYKKLIILIITILIITGIIFIIRRPKDYSKSYKINSYMINESFIKEKNEYIFYTNYDSKAFDISITNKYIQKKKLIKSIKKLENDTETCLYFISDYLNTYPICYKDENRVDYSLVTQDESFYSLKKPKELNDTYKSIKINTLIGKNYAIWNHYGYDHINEYGSKEEKIFKKETYYDEYSFQIDKLILIPNLDESYFFKKFMILNIETGELSNWRINKEISYDFYLLGVLNNKAYIVDRKNKIEYELDPYKKDIKIISNSQEGKIYEKEWKSIRLNKLINEDNKFSYKANIEFLLDNKQLYMRYNDNETTVLVTNTKVDKIIESNYTEVYYLSEDKLYYYSPEYGEVQLLEYSEWSFNEKNTVYIY